MAALTSRDNVQQEPASVLLGTAVIVGPCVGSVFQKLFDQVAVGSLQFHPVETRLDRIQAA